MEAAGSFGTLVPIRQSAKRFVTEDHELTQSGIMFIHEKYLMKILACNVINDLLLLKSSHV